QVIEERVDTSTDAEKQFVWGLRYIDDLVLRDRDTTGNGTLDERLYSLQDANWNVTALADASGDVQERFAYQPYGESEELDPDFTTYSGSNLDWTVRFTGRELDLNTRLQINRNRYLHLQLGCWITRDPIGYTGSQWNLYQYVGGFPINTFDPVGERQIADFNVEWLGSSGCYDYCIAAGIPDHECHYFCGFNSLPPDWPGEISPGRLGMPIFWGEESIAGEWPPHGVEFQDGSESCNCVFGMNGSFERPRGTLADGTTPGPISTPGRGDAQCRIGERRLMKYQGICEPRPNAETKCPCRQERGSCSIYTIWECDNNRGRSNWKQKERFMGTKCD
ncbi:hypothetical protein GC197_16050, partial [bacterium]|nr:hypothetical protein [bacterium]